MQALSDWAASDLFDQKDRAVLAFTDSLARENRVDDALYAEVIALFSEKEVLKLSFTVSLAGMVNRVHATFRTDVDDATIAGSSDTPFCALPAR